MIEKPPLDPRNYRPPFFVEKENEEVALDHGMRNCVGYRNDGSVCGNVLDRGLRYYCSGSCMMAAKMRGDYRHD